MRRVALALLAPLVACGDAEPQIFSSWSIPADAERAAPAVGPEDRVVIAARAGTGGFTTIDVKNGLTVEGPFTGAPLTDHPPLMVGARVYVLSKIGKLEAFDLAGQSVFSAPSAGNLGVTTDLAAGPDGTVVVASTAGEVVAFAADTGDERFRSTVDVGTAPTLAVDEMGNTFVATSGGRVEGVDASGVKFFDVRTGALAAGPSARGGRVAVGTADGVAVFATADGNLAFEHPRSGRVVGTRYLDSGALLAWGEDGVLERLAADGSVEMVFRTRPEGTAAVGISSDVIVFDNGRYGVVDDSGRGHLVDTDGQAIVTRELDGVPLPRLVRSANNLLVGTFGSEVRAFDFNAE